jgi:hypothetical protein
MTKRDEKLVTVFTSYRRESFLVAVSILNGSGIRYVTLNENLDQAYGADSYVIQVAESDLKAAEELLTELNEKRELSEAEKQEDEVKYFKVISLIVLAIVLIFVIVFFVS